MKEKLQNIKEEALKAIEAADMPEKLNDVRVKFLGKKGELTAVLKGMKDVAPEDRPKVGQMVNETRAAIEEKMEEIRIINRAKCLLIETRGMTEAEAHHYIEKEAMNSRRTREQVAEKILEEGVPGG